MMRLGSVLVGALLVLTSVLLESVYAQQDRATEKAIGERMRLLAVSQLNRALSDMRGRSPVEAAKHAAAAWDADSKICRASARSREENYSCGDMVVYGNAAALKWLEEHQKAGETIYGAQVCLRNPPPGVKSCFAPSVLNPANQSEDGCRAWASSQRNLPGANNDYLCVARTARDQPWITKFGVYDGVPK